MGLDLKLLVLRGPQELGHTEIFARTELEFDRDYDVFCQIQGYGRSDRDREPTIMVQPIPPQMWLMTQEEGKKNLQRRRDNGMGDDLTFTYAQQLKKLELPKTTGPFNRAIKAFIKALPDEIPIILYWH